MTAPLSFHCNFLFSPLYIFCKSEITNISIVVTRLFATRHSETAVSFWNFLSRFRQICHISDIQYFFLLVFGAFLTDLSLSEHLLFFVSFWLFFS